MTFRNLATAGAVVSVLYAIGALAMPGGFQELTGAEGSQLLLQWLGSSATGYAVLLWMARDVTEMAAQRAVSIGMLAGFGVGFVVTLLAQMGDAATSAGWVSAILFLLLAAGFGYAAFMKPMPA